jgi:hypothetical protein
MNKIFRKSTLLLPFNGLGLDLSPVFVRADSLRIRIIRVQFVEKAPAGGAFVSGASGYALLLWLNCEIRGT